MSMRITGLIAENFQRLIAVNITPDGRVVQITGKNANGKSSCLDAIAAALEGLDACPDEPIHKGQKKSKIVVKLSGDRELLVTRQFARKEEGGFTTKLTVESPDGSLFPKAQTTLNELLGELGFDPLGFAEAKSDEQFNALRSFVPGVDFALIDAQNKGDYERRTTVNRQAREAEAAANQIVVPQDTPDQPLNEQDLASELQAAGILNTDTERRKVMRAQAAKDVEAYRAQAQLALDAIAPELEQINQRLNTALAAIDEQIAVLTQKREALLNQSDPDFQAAEKKLRDQAATFTKTADDLQARIDAAEALPAIVDTLAIIKRMDTARVTNANVERKRQKAVHLATAKRFEDESKTLTDAMDARTAARDAAIAAAKMPVAGLGFAVDEKGNGYVTLNGVTFKQASTADKLRTSCAIAMAKNPKLRVCFIRNGSNLDEDNLRLIGEMAEEHDFQVFVERVDSSGKVGVVIENGYSRDAGAGERSAA